MQPWHLLHVTLATPSFMGQNQCIYGIHVFSSDILGQSHLLREREKQESEKHDMDL